MLGRSDPQKEDTLETPQRGNLSRTSTTLLTIEGNEAKFEGKLVVSDSVQVECEMGGELKVGGKLVIGEKGVVRADVETVDAVIHGEYEGNMVATGDVEIASTGRVSGNLETNSLVISKGGFFNGNVSKIEEVKKEKKEKKEEPSVYPMEEKLIGQQP